MFTLVRRVLRCHVKLLVFGLAGTVLLTVLVTLLWRSFWPTYLSEALLGVVPPETSILQPNSRRQIPRDMMVSLTSSSAKMILTDTVLENALRSEEIAKTKWFSQNRLNALDALRDHLSVFVIPDTDMLRVAFTGHDPGEITNIVNAVAQAAVIDSNEYATTLIEGQARALDSARESCQLELAQLRNQKAKNANKDFPLSDQQVRVMTDKLQMLLQKNAQLQAEKAQVADSLEAAQDPNEVDEDQLPNIEQDPVLVSLRRQRSDWMVRRNELVAKLGPKHRDVGSVNDAIANLDAQIRNYTEDLKKKAAVKAVDNLRGVSANLSKQLDQVNGEIDATRRTLKELEESRQRAREFAEREKSLVEQIDRIDAKTMELRLLFQDGGTLFIRREAKTPRDPIRPKWSVTLPIGVLLGAIVFTALAFILELADRSIKSASDLAGRTLPPLLGLVPHVDDLNESIPDPRLAFSTHPDSLCGESFRQIRTCLMLDSQNKWLRTLLITSPLPEDGRTTIALNLAAAIARGAKKVLVVDANFRQPALGKLFPQCGQTGLSQVLVGRCGWADASTEVEPGLFIMPAGPLLVNPSELLAKSNLAAMLDSTRGHFDHVILDGPPALILTDSPMISAVVNGTILVTRAGIATHGMISRTRALFDRVGRPVIGLVLNDVRASAGGYFRKSYQVFYGYGRASAADKPA